MSTASAPITNGHPPHPPRSQPNADGGSASFAEQPNLPLPANLAIAEPNADAVTAGFNQFASIATTATVKAVIYLARAASASEVEGAQREQEIIRAAPFVLDSVYDLCLALSSVVWVFDRIPSTLFAVRCSTDPLDELNPRAPGNRESIFKQVIWAALTPTGLPFFKSGIDEVNGTTQLVTDDASDVLNWDRSEASEKWFFVNGICTDQNWLKKNCEKLSKRFGKQVAGIHVPTYGVITDLISCITNRNFNAATKDILKVVFVVSTELNRGPRVQTIRLLCHSKGTLVVKLALDILARTRPRSDLRKLYISTFAACDQIWPDYGYGLLEHFANEKDTVANLGVINKRYGKRYEGNIHVRPKVAGHVFNMYYSLHGHDYLNGPPIVAPSLLAIREQGK